MKFVYIFLALSILTQAHKVCASGVCHKTMSEQTEICSVNDVGKKSCCQHKKQSSTDHSSDQEHNGETCSCLCCLKVFLPTNTLTFREVVEYLLPVSPAKIWSENTNGFDYMEELYHPPQLLS
ncbi:MAG: hypothetical protein WAT79_11370 [Saprospiraceae bacterium]